jgi:hypothetical protein
MEPSARGPGRPVPRQSLDLLAGPGSNRWVPVRGPVLDSIDHLLVKRNVDPWGHEHSDAYGFTVKSASRPDSRRMRTSVVCVRPSRSEIREGRGVVVDRVDDAKRQPARLCLTGFAVVC